MGIQSPSSLTNAIIILSAKMCQQLQFLMAVFEREVRTPTTTVNDKLLSFSADADMRSAPLTTVTCIFNDPKRDTAHEHFVDFVDCVSVRMAILYRKGKRE